MHSWPGMTLSDMNIPTAFGVWSASLPGYSHMLVAKTLALLSICLKPALREAEVNVHVYANALEPKSVLDEIGLSALWPGDDNIGQYRISHSCTLILRIDRVGWFKRTASASS